MPGIYTVDASVFLNAFNPSESGHEESFRFLSQLQEDASAIVVPTLLLPEVAATVARGREDAVLAREFAEALSQLAHLTLIPLDSTLAGEAVRVAAEYRLRGSDAVYAAVALRFDSTLVTRDREQRERLVGLLSAVSPTQALESREG